MKRTYVQIYLVAAGLLAGSALHAQAPKYAGYGVSASTYGTAAAIATTTPAGFEDNRSGYVVAAIVDSSGGLEVEAWQDTTKALSEVGSADADTNNVVAAAAAGVDSSHVVTADVDVNGVLSLRTWRVGTSGIAQLNHYDSAENTANPLGFTPFLGVVALSATQVLTAYEDFSQNLMLQAWTVSNGTTAPQMAGAAANGGPALQVAIAAIDSSTVITAVIAPDSKTIANDLQIATWGVDSTGVHLQDQKVVKSVVGDVYPSVAVGATTVETANFSEPPYIRFTRRAFTPISNQDGLIEVIDWQISSSGTISTVGKPSIVGPDDYALAVAGSMLQTGIPMTVYAQLGNFEEQQDISVGWFEEGLNSEYTEITGLGTAVNSVASTTAGSDFTALDPYRAVHAYFITGAVTSGGFLPPSTTNKGKLKLQVWSYPIVLPLL